MLGMKSTHQEPEKQVNLPELLTLEEAAQYLKCHPNTLRQWDKNGVLPAIRIGVKKIRRYKREDLQKFLEPSI